MEETNVMDQIYTWLKYGNYQRTLHYHNTPFSSESLYRQQLEYVRERYEVCTPEQALGYLNNRGQEAKKSLIIGAFDGYRNNYDVLYPLLEEYGIPGWFLLVTDFIDCPVEQQEDSLTKYRMQWVPEEYEDGRYAMNWTEAGQIAESHTIVNHTATHYPLTKDTKREVLEYEILHAQELILKNIGIKTEIMSWLGGAWLEQNQQASRILKEHGYHLQMGYRLEYFEKDAAKVKEECWECAAASKRDTVSLDREIRRYDQIIGNIGWYRAVPAILPFYQEGRTGNGMVKKEDAELAAHFASLANRLNESYGMELNLACSRALEVLAVCSIGEGFPFGI